MFFLNDHKKRINSLRWLNLIALPRLLQLYCVLVGRNKRKRKNIRPGNNKL